MKLYYHKIRHGLVRMGGSIVKFVNNVAEVDDAVGAKILALKFPGLYEDGKQPAFETPKELKMQANFNTRENWYKGEIERLTRTNEGRKDRIKVLEAELANWKQEYVKLQDQNARLLREAQGSSHTIEPEQEIAEPIEQEVIEPKDEGIVPQAETEEPTSAEAAPVIDETEELGKELVALTKAELLRWAEENDFVLPKAVAKGSKSEIVRYILENV